MLVTIEQRAQWLTEKFFKDFPEISRTDNTTHSISHVMRDLVVLRLDHPRDVQHAASYFLNTVAHGELSLLARAPIRPKVLKFFSRRITQLHAITAAESRCLMETICI